MIQSSDLFSLAGGVLATHSLKTLSIDDKLEAISKLTSLMAPDGKFKMQKDSQPSVENVHFALEMLSVYASDSSGAEIVGDLFEKAFRMIPTGDGEEQSDVLLMIPLSKLTDKKLRLVGARLVVATEILLNLKYSDDIVVQSKVYEALRIIATYKASPLYMGLTEKKFEQYQPLTHQLHLEVLDVFGAVTPLDSVEVVSVKNVAKDGMLFQGQQMVLAEEGGSAVLDMTSSSLNAGRYIVQLSITATGRPKSIPFHGYFAVYDKVDVKNVQVNVVSSDDDEDQVDNAILSVSQPNQLTTSASVSDKIFVNFDIVSTSTVAIVKKPHQVFVVFTPHHTQQQQKQRRQPVHFTAKKANTAAAAGPDATTSSSMKYNAVITLGDNLQTFNYHSGDYTVSILVGDAALVSPVEYVLGTITVQLPMKPTAQHLPLYAQSLLHASDTTMAALPEIEHVMRPPAKRASDFMAALFTALTLLPLAAFVLFMIVYVKPDLQRLASISGLALLICLTLLLSLYVSYWLSLDGVSFYDTIRFLCFLFPATVLVSRYALGQVTEMRLQQQQKKVASKQN